MDEYKRLLLENKAWATEMIEKDPDYFKSLAHIQTPKFLWIGCADSRVPANEITNTKPGEIFVHRNVANLVVHTDINMLSVLQYAVEVLAVEHIIVCGHYGCGGVKAAMGNKSFGLINKWIRNIKDVYRSHRLEVDKGATEEERFNNLVEWNVREQVQHLTETTIIQKAWKKRQKPDIHGWVYGLDNGLVKELVTIKSGDPIDPLYKYEFGSEEVY
ncbi:MAG: carbonate dehydratase [Bacteroidia bacterium]